ncbi:PREDICTED: pentatricopeptide repeat-containing protein At5g66500, mitochondrial [Nelumbo nucifera]|uniref:Pentatricopeptide repeat-containing protein At5g66500, mitochondrial n=1 Tax=Nelumbo nucifera TaxID=4432 RepID=A0A1U8Q507_NELNU|nr:PREDICTED: pentatricopeptide repeat-containing protein At5g66500, mitochondrial [Nelumbo nucifera]
MSLVSRLVGIPKTKSSYGTFTTNVLKPHKGVEHAKNLFDETSNRDLWSLNALLAAQVRNGDAHAAWHLFRKMHRTRHDLDSYTFTPVIGASTALADLKRGRQVHALVIKTGAVSETVTQTAVMDMYSKCGHLSESVRLFKETRSKDVVTWNTMISGFLCHNLTRDALRVFEAMRKSGVHFSDFTLCSVLKACASLKALKQGREAHALVIVRACDMLVLGTALIDFYSSCGLMDEAINVFRNLNCRKDDAIYNSLVSGCVRNRKYKEAFSIMNYMKPNEIALTSILSACSECSDLWIGKQIHCVTIRLGFEWDTQLLNTLLDMYAKCGKISIARFLFDRIPQKNVVSWTSIIDAYGSHGYGAKALEMFDKMSKEQTGVSPNSVTFLAVLSACGHSGLVEKGRECFVSMRLEHGIIPRSEHYACFIDLLGRAGQLEEAWGVFYDMQKMGNEPMGAVWAALLNACRINLDVKRGEFVARRLLELEPDKPGNYILLSNFYAAIGRWDVVEELRNLLREKSLSKEAGSSWITIEC